MYLLTWTKISFNRYPLGKDEGSLRMKYLICLASRIIDSSQKHFHLLSYVTQESTLWTGCFVTYFIAEELKKVKSWAFKYHLPVFKLGIQLFCLCPDLPRMAKQKAASTLKLLVWFPFDSGHTDVKVCRHFSPSLFKFHVVYLSCFI